MESQNNASSMQINQNAHLKVWKIIALCASAATLVLAAFSVLFILQANNNDNEIVSLRQDLESKQEELAKCSNTSDTGTDIEDAPHAPSSPIVDPINFTELSSAALVVWPNAEIAFSSTFGGEISFRNNRDNTYQIASFGVGENGYGFAGFAYRSIPNGTWTIAKNQSGHQAPDCNELSAEEKHIFAGFFNCS